MFDPRLLQTFLEVSRTGSMADAAFALGVTAPAVSQQIGRLERQLGTKLLKRSNNGVVLTATGEVLAERAIRVLGEISSLFDAVSDAAGNAAPSLRVTSFASGCVHLLPHVLNELRGSFADLHFDLSEEHDDVAPFDRLAAGGFDVAITHRYDHVPWTVAAGVELIELGHEPVDVLVARTHHLSTLPAIDLSELANENWVLFSPENIATMSIVREAADVGFVPRSVFQSSHYQTVIALVGAGTGVTLLPRMITAELQMTSSVAIPLKKSSLGRTVYVSYRSGDHRRHVHAFAAATQKRFDALRSMVPTRQ